jgi:hypothetical protein
MNQHQNNCSIIGGGISGLYFALKYNEKYPKRVCSIYESYKVPGGRIATSYTKEGQYERGAARFNNHHTTLLRLIKKFNKTPMIIPTAPIFLPKDKKYCKNIETFKSMWETINKDIFSKTSKKQLINTTLYELMIKYKTREFADLFLHLFNYHAEIKHMNADLARILLEEDIRPDLIFYYLKEGLESLIQSIVKYLKSRGVNIYTNHTIFRYHKLNNPDGHIITGINKDTTSKNFFVISEKIVFACNRKCIETIDINNINTQFFKKYLEYTNTQSLNRIFALYPKNKNKSIWFENVPKIVTDSDIGFIIPSNSSTGLIQISYTDSGRSDKWWKLYKQNNNNFKKILHNEVKSLFPSKDIPEPLWVKSYYWKDGGTYWNIGVNVEQFLLTNRKSLAKQDIFIVGEAFSMRPAWMEGGLRSVDYVFTNNMI